MRVGAPGLTLAWGLPTSRRVHCTRPCRCRFRNELLVSAVQKKTGEQQGGRCSEVTSALLEANASTEGPGERAEKTRAVSTNEIG